MSARRLSRRDLEATIVQLRRELRDHRHEIQQLRTESEILREAAEPLIRHAPGRERFAFIQACPGRFGVKLMRRPTAPSASPASSRAMESRSGGAGSPD